MRKSYRKWNKQRKELTEALRVTRVEIGELRGQLTALTISLHSILTAIEQGMSAQMDLGERRAERQRGG